MRIDNLNQFQRMGGLNGIALDVPALHTRTAWIPQMPPKRMSIQKSDALNLKVAAYVPQNGQSVLGD